MAEKAVVDVNLCVGCGVCIDACPAQAISMNDNVAKVDAEKCVGCGVCVDSCPSQAISMK